MERKKRSKGIVWEFCYANKIFGTFGFEIKACGQKLVKFCTHTHTTAAKLVVRIAWLYLYCVLIELNNTVSSKKIRSGYIIFLFIAYSRVISDV